MLFTDFESAICCQKMSQEMMQMTLTWT